MQSVRMSSPGASLPRGNCRATKIKRRLHGKAGFRSVLVAPGSSANALDSTSEPQAFLSQTYIDCVDIFRAQYITLYTPQFRTLLPMPMVILCKWATGNVYKPPLRRPPCNWAAGCTNTNRRPYRDTVAETIRWVGCTPRFRCVSGS